MNSFYFAIVPILFYISATHACRDLRLTYERCTSSNQCLALEPNFPPFCGGRDTNDKLQDCGPPGVKNCMCRPFTTHYCTSNADCLDGEYCGTSSRSGNSLCVGCMTRYDDFLKTYFRPVQGLATSLRCPKPRREDCGLGGDYCSVTMPCNKQYSCINNYDSSLFACSWESRHCRCAIPSNDKYLSAIAPNNLSYKKCKEGGDCLKREVCARYTTRNENVCISCDLANVAYDIKLIGRERCNSSESIRKQPEAYVEGPNGKTMDRCRTDTHCRKSRVCVRRPQNRNGPFVPCENSGDGLCFCRPPELAKCSDGADCDVGESCVTEPLFKLNRNCASNAYLDVVSENQYDVIGARSYPPKGTLVNNDKCEFDWQCSGMRRCTHTADLYGRCAGRRQCSCQPLFRQRCYSDSRCDKGEVCATTIGTFSHPSCISSVVVRKNPYYVKYDDVSKLLSKPFRDIKKGLTGQPCLTKSDCMGERSCVHMFDLKDDKGCDGTRANCVCKNVSEKARKIAQCEMNKDCVPEEVCVSYEDEVPINKRCVAMSAIREARATGINYTVFSN